MSKLSRRSFMRSCGSLAVAMLAACDKKGATSNALDDFLLEQMRRNHIPGLAVTVVRNGSVSFSQGYGFANIENKVPMTPATVQNIGSVSKPVVTSAVMQCVERGYLQLDDDINAHLPLPVRNPNHPDSPITVLQLLTHTSSIADGSHYGYGYRCGNSEVSLHDWISGYFQQGGEFYVAEENFHTSAPGEKYEYNNVAFALLAYIVQVVVGKDFDEHCQAELFGPLGMDDTTWFVANTAKSQHATPYAYVSKGIIDSPSWGGIELGLVSGEQPPAGFEGLVADCIYDHPNFADGFLRSSTHDLAKFQLMLLGNGALGGVRVLQEKSVRRMFHGQGITWSQRDLPNGSTVWGHAGGDPGVGALFDFRPELGDGVVILVNTHGVDLDEISARLLRL